MTTHRRGLLLRGIVVTALVAAALTGLAVPAYADDTVGVSVLPLGDFSPGESQTLRVQVENKTNNPLAPVTVTVDGLSSDLQVSNPQGCDPSGGNSCSLTFTAKGTKNVSFTVKESATPNLGAGQQRTDHGSVQVAAFGSHSDSANVDVRLHGPDQAPAQAVTEVSGQVVDSTTSVAIKDAIVTLQDGANKSRQTGSDANGRFRFTSATDPIAPGTLSLSASKDQFEAIPRTFDGRAGQSVTTVKLQLRPVAATPTGGAVVPPDLPSATDTPSAAGGNAANTRNAGNGTSLFSWVLIVLGGLLVLLGIGAIVLLLVRRKDDGDEPDEEYEGGPPNRRGPAPVPASHGVYRGGADPTMVARTGQLGETAMANGRGAADATAMIRPSRPGNEFPDPYSPDPYQADPYQADPYQADPYQADPYPQSPRSPRPTSAMPGPYPPATYGASDYGAPGYPPGGRAPDGYAGDPRPGYGSDGQGYPPPGGQGYPPPGSPDYGPPAGRPEPGYGGSGSGYPSGGSGGGYPGYRGEGPPQQYDEPAGRHDDGGYRSGYEPRGAHAQDPRAGYDAGYDRNAGYDRVPEEPRGGYDDPGYAPEPHYDDPAGTPSRRRSAPPNHGDRRPLDWLDD